MIYTPSYFEIKDREKIIEFICDYFFASIVSSKDNSISNISKIPLMLKEEGAQLFLEGYFARANPHWKYLVKHPKLSAIFDDPHDYISPRWYENSSVEVPTWNYSTVIVEGEAEIIDSSDWLLKSVMEFTDKFEKDKSWEKSVDRDYLKNLSRGIVGIKIRVRDIHSKFKLNQNKNEVDKIM